MEDCHVLSVVVNLIKEIATGWRMICEGYAFIDDYLKQASSLITTVSSTYHTKQVSRSYRLLFPRQVAFLSAVNFDQYTQESAKINTWIEIDVYVENLMTGRAGEVKLICGYFAGMIR